MTGIVTSLLLGLSESKPMPALLFLGQISYSLYLVHVPIGGRVINLSQRFVHDTPGKIAVLAVAVATTIAAAWLLYRYVERPAQEWASRIGYRRPDKRA